MRKKTSLGLFRGERDVLKSIIIHKHTQTEIAAIIRGRKKKTDRTIEEEEKSTT